jgi:hypothetical protein
MEDLLNFAMLICATLGSMAFGILAAYGILRAGFAMMRRPTKTTVIEAGSEAARAS